MEAWNKQEEVWLYLRTQHMGGALMLARLSSLALQGPGAIYLCFLLGAQFLINFLLPTVNLEKCTSSWNTTSLLATAVV